MKKWLTQISIMLLLICNIAYAEGGTMPIEMQTTRLTTAKTDVKCSIDGLNVKCYAIDGFMYIPVGMKIVK